ncbi:MAG TPA: hybrid sensor histidine kinase/response regulator [Holophagaceae bacterium]|nr:hybrid sensor histidine kinase/response regulator [Holophagaceae bacterium]
MENHTGNVLIVDDNPMNLDLLGQLLRDHGYKVRAVPSGAMALEAVKAAPPELVLMDVTMPGMDGYEACRRIKADPDSEAIPVLFLSAMDDPLDKVRAFEAGGADYVTKPFQPEEVMARVTHHLQLSRTQSYLETQNRLLLEANAKLQELDHMKAQFTAMLVHDIRNPVGLMALALSLHRETGRIPPEVLDSAEKAIQKTADLLDALLELFRSDTKGVSLQAVPLPATDLLAGLAEAHRPLAERARIRFQTAWADPLPELSGDPEKLDRIFSNLLGNALKFTPEGGVIRLSAEVVEGQGVEQGLRWLRVGVEDSGPGIPAEDLPFIFDPFHQAQGQAPGSGRGHGVGLGLAIVNRFVAAHRGRIEVQSQVGVGTAIQVLLPL